MINPDFDLVVRGGTLVDGGGGAPFESDVAVRDGRIAALGKVSGRGREEIDARGRLVTPGFVDIHTHYDGHAIWSNRLNPSSFHGVTTAVMGNCGVGFAPCRPEDRERLVSLMEGVEDIPGVVLTAGLTWDWQTFPEYLDRLAERRFDMDVAAYLPHAPLRVFVMGERAARREPATRADIDQMQALTKAAISAGAIGFSTSRTLNHKSRDGWVTPSYDAGEQELCEIASAVGEGSSAVLQVISDFDDVNAEFEMIKRIAARSQRPLSISVMQTANAPQRWRTLLDLIDEANAEGLRLTAQVAPRPIGALLSLENNLPPFAACPTYAEMSGLPFEERRKRVAAPEIRAKLIAELAQGTSDARRSAVWRLDNMYPQSDPPDYEPGPDKSIAAMARGRGVSPEQAAFEVMMEEGGRRIIYMPTSNYHGGSAQAVEEMLTRPHTVIGLGDGGAHCGFICDASFPTHFLARWSRDGDIPLGRAVKALTYDTAQVVGLQDRGRVAVGLRADLNVIDLDKLGLRIPEMVYDLPCGSGRLRQVSTGYVATLVAGEVTYRDGVATQALPGRLVRGAAA
jgi:N-acyl-D-aspartate/D-glutamate deacylase